MKTSESSSFVSKDTVESATTRKNDHIRICLQEDIEPKRFEAFSRVRLYPEALPEFALEDVDTNQTFLGRRFSLPLLFTGMTGGVERGQEINETLALAAEKFNIPMGLGSQKMMIQTPALKKLFDVKKKAPKLFLMGNIGAVSFNYTVETEDILRLIEDLKLDAFALHVNALQECIQPEGESNFRNLLVKIEALVKKSPVPILVKEVGCGIGASTLKKLLETGVQAIDVGGQGGTSWSLIEGLRADSQGRRLGELFQNWGLSTEESLVQCAQVLQKSATTLPLIATGGIRNGLQVAKAVALGASMVGVGLPIFKAAAAPSLGLSPLETVESELNFFKRGLEIAMFCSGARTLSQLKDKILKGDFNA